MTSRPSKGSFQPFKDLDTLLKQNKIVLAPERAPAPASNKGQPLSPQQEAMLFAKAMADVTPLSFDRHWQFPKRSFQYQSCQDMEEKQAVEALEQLIKTGQGFVVAHTPEYMEALGPGMGPEIVRRLHQGYYAVQDYVDLHGLRAHEAEQVLHAFIRRALANGKRSVLVIHGRGLTSPHKPVLKHKLYAWLTRGPLRKHVIALASARACDGGAGATYVLLRQRPLTKRMRKAKRRFPS